MRFVIAVLLEVAHHVLEHTTHAPPDLETRRQDELDADRWAFERLPEDEMTRRSTQFLACIAARRTVRDFSPEPVPFSLIENAVRWLAASVSS